MAEELHHDKSTKVKDDGDQAISDISDILADDTPRVLDPKAERALVWKLDLHLLPVLAVMYLFNAVRLCLGSRTNVKYVRPAGFH